MRGIALATGLAGLLVAAGCADAGRPDTQPDAMSAEAHRAEAHREDAEAARHLEQYDPTAGVPYGSDPLDDDFDYSYDDGDLYWGIDDYNPTEGHLRRGTELERAARQHREAARVLERFEEAQCKSFPPETRVLCPILGPLEIATDIPGGTRIRLEKDTDVNATIAHMRCHMAFARARGWKDMETCPLYMKGLKVHRVGRSRSIDLTVDRPEAVQDLRRRAARHAITRQPHEAP